MLLLIAAFGLAATEAWPADLRSASMEAVIDEIMAHPNFTQTCDGAYFEDRRVPLPIYDRLLPRMLGLASGQLAALQARREELVPTLKAALLKLHPEKPAELEQYGAHQSLRPDQLNALYLFMVSDLHVIEALPELLILEERLSSAIQTAEEHPKRGLPNLAWDGVIYFGQGKPISGREKFLEFCRCDQCELLSLMLRLLREQRYPRLLASDFEKRYREALDETEAMVDKDAATHFHQQMVTVPFNAQVRKGVRTLVSQFLQEVPAEQWKRAAP